MKKRLSLLMVYMLAFMLAGCGTGKPGEPPLPSGGGTGILSDAPIGDGQEAGQIAGQMEINISKPSEGNPGDQEIENTGEAAGGGEETENTGEAAGGGPESHITGQKGQDGDADISGTSEASGGVSPGGGLNADSAEREEPPEGPPGELPEDGIYSSKDDVALYIYLYGRLPSNFITKKEAEKLGWEGGSLEPYAPGKCIGGNRFGNYEGLLPEKDGRSYTECDIDTMGAEKRGAKRIVFSNDGLVYYTEDHYGSQLLRTPLLEANLGRYAGGLLKVLRDAENENTAICLKMEEKF